MKFQFLPENFSRSENAPPFETRKIRLFEVERIFLENKKMVHDIVRLNRPNPKNRVDPEIESRVVKIALDNPALGQQRVSNELRKEGLFISPGGVRSVWQRHDLETFQKRLKALEAKVAQEGIILTESQLQADR